MGSRRWRIVTVAAVATSLCAAVRAADPAGHPDFSGVWAQYVESGQPRFVRSGQVLDLPYTPEGRRKEDEYRALVAPNADNPGAHCLGYGMPQSMVFSGGYPMEIIQKADVIGIIYEAHNEVRHIYLDGRIIAPEDRIPSRNGYSAAHWEGDTLVVETTALREQEDESYPHSDQAVITERYHLTARADGAKVLVNDWTLTDPAFYTRPVSAQKKWLLDPKGILLPYECNEEGWLDHLDALRKAKAEGKPPPKAAGYP